MSQLGSDDCLTLDVSEEQDHKLYIPRFQRPKLSTSPSERLWSQTVSPTLERRMNKHIYKEGKRCLVENITEGSLHYVHCLSRRLDPQRINDLEFAWGMRRGTLNLDTRSNVFCLSAKLQALWEEYKWILIPEDSILDLYRTADTKFPDIGDGPYKYRLFAQPDMKFVPIHRLVPPNEEIEAPKAEHFRLSSYPFTNLGILTSHIHPKFAICHIAAVQLGKMNQIMGYYSWASPAALDVVIKCIDIVALWSPLANDVASRHSGFMKSQIGSDEAYSETSDKTANRRLCPHLCDQRLIEEQGYAYIKEDEIVRLRHVEDAPHLLTAQKLKFLEERVIRDQTVGDQWIAAIEVWRSNISGTPEELVF